MSNEDEITVLKLTLHDRLVGYLAGYQDGRNVLSFSGDFREDTGRPTFSLITHSNFPSADKAAGAVGSGAACNDSFRRVLEELGFA